MARRAGRLCQPAAERHRQRALAGDQRHDTTSAATDSSLFDVSTGRVRPGTQQRHAPGAGLPDVPGDRHVVWDAVRRGVVVRHSQSRHLGTTSGLQRLGVRGLGGQFLRLTGLGRAAVVRRQLDHRPRALVGRGADAPGLRLDDRTGVSAGELQLPATRWKRQNIEFYRSPTADERASLHSTCRSCSARGSVVSTATDACRIFRWLLFGSLQIQQIAASF